LVSFSTVIIFGGRSRESGGLVHFSRKELRKSATAEVCQGAVSAKYIVRRY
jgi:hypothetical protein